MNSILNYLIEANICLLIFGAIYFLLLRKETDFRFRRLFILTSGVLTVILPLLSLSFLPGSELKAISELPTVLLPEFTVGGTNEAAESETGNLINYLPVAYGVIAFIVAQLFIFQIMQIAWFTFSNKTSIRKQEGTYIIYTNGTLPTFSFINLLFFDNSVELSRKEKAKILYHEMVHINQLHSFDVILFELLKIGMWINPMAWYFRKEIQDVHEYLADHAVIKNTDEQQYTSLLAKMALSKVHLSLGHHFNKSKTLKRIEMMKTAKQNVKTWKTLLVAPLIGFTIFIVSCNDEVMQDINTTMETATQMEVPADLQDKYAELQKRYPSADIAYLEVDGTTEDALNRLKDVDPNSIAHIKVFKPENKIGLFVNRNGPIQNIADNDGIFAIVDESAMPPGGYKAFYDHLSTNLKYPAQARKQGVEGKVYVQFIVNKDGSLSDLKAVKGIGAGCDSAAIAAIAQGGTWSAPKQNGVPVKQRIILPITFKLDGDNPGTQNSEKVSEKVIELEEVDDSK